MPILSLKYITPLKVVSLCIVTLGYILHAVGITAKEWDGIHGSTTQYPGNNLDFDAYQNLWGKYDKDAKSTGTSVYGVVDLGIPDWKMKVIILESSAVALGFLASFLVFIASFITIASRRKIAQITLNTFAVLMLLAAGAESIVGIKLYLEKYTSRLGDIVTQIIENEAKHGNPGLYKLSWPPYLCISAGGMYILAGVILIIDTIITKVSQSNTIEVLPITENSNQNNPAEPKGSWN